MKWYEIIACQDGFFFLFLQHLNVPYRAMNFSKQKKTSSTSGVDQISAKKTRISLKILFQVFQMVHFVWENKLCLSLSSSPWMQAGRSRGALFYNLLFSLPPHGVNALNFMSWESLLSHPSRNFLLMRMRLFPSKQLLTQVDKPNSPSGGNCWIRGVAAGEPQVSQHYLLEMGS